MKIMAWTLGSDDVTLTAYLLDQSKDLSNATVRPAVLVLPGGGYFYCSDREAEPIALAYAAEGYHTFVLRYTVGEKGVFPKVLQDADAAMAFILENADTFGVDPAKIAAIGFSAGGHLAAMLGTAGKYRPSALILGYPCILASMGELVKKSIPSADQHVNMQTPPTFLFSTADDGLVPIENTLAFAAALNRAEVPFEVHIFEHGQHGLSLSKPMTSNGKQGLVEPRFATWFPMSVEWLKGHWNDFPSNDTNP